MTFLLTLAESGRQLDPQLLWYLVPGAVAGGIFGWTASWIQSKKIREESRKTLSFLILGEYQTLTDEIARVMGFLMAPETFLEEDSAAQSRFKKVIRIGLWFEKNALAHRKNMVDLSIISEMNFITDIKNFYALALEALATAGKQGLNCDAFQESLDQWTYMKWVHEHSKPGMK